MEADGMKDFGRRLFGRDATLFAGDAGKVAQRLGWVDAFARIDAGGIRRLVKEIRAEGFRRVVVLGMGGSSLAPEVSARWFGFPREGGCEVAVLDTSNPVEIAPILATAARETLFLVSSKSGSTVETMSLAEAVRERLANETKDAKRRIVAICDPGTSLVAWGEKNAREVVPAPHDCGGRFSAHTPFHLLPFALGGGDLDGFLRVSEEAAREIRAGEGAGIALAAFLAEAARGGRDKVLIAATAATRPILPWIQQLVAESTGKGGKGLLPIPAEFLPGDRIAGPDRVRVAISLAGETIPDAHEIPDFRISIGRADLGGEMLRWMAATAWAGISLGVNPFDEPDVSLAKEKSRSALARGEEGAPAPASIEQARRVLEEALAGLAPPGYLDLLAFLPRAPDVLAGLEALRSALARKTHAVVMSEIGPRYLHSTGQFHKGGSAGGRFVVLTHRIPRGDEIPIPGTPHTFAGLVRAQARGDAEALRERGRPVSLIDLGENPAGFLAGLAREIGS